MLETPDDAPQDIAALGYCPFFYNMELNERLLIQVKSRLIRMRTIRTGAEAARCDLERFVCRENIARYRKLLGESRDETQRLTIEKLLAAEETKLRDM